MGKSPNRLLTIIQKHRVISISLLLIVLFGGVGLTFEQGKRVALEQVEYALDQRAEDNKRNLDAFIDKSLLVPRILSGSGVIHTAVLEQSPAALAEANKLLEEIAFSSRAVAIYGLDIQGKTIVTSNYRSPTDSSNRNLQFLAYFQQAKNVDVGRFLIKEETDYKVGFYLTTRIMIAGNFRGLIVMKILLADLNAQADKVWRRDRELALMADDSGFIYASPVSSLSQQTFPAIPGEPARESSAARKDKSESVNITIENRLNEKVNIVRYKAIFYQALVQKVYYFPDIQQRLYLHFSASRYWEIVATYTIIGASIALAVLLASIMLYQRWTYEAKLVQLAIRDPLSGLYTRLYMEEWGHSAIRVHERDPKAGFALILLDLDFFKQINDEHGHLTGDQIIRHIGDIIMRSVRGDDIGVRYGGEELAILAKCVDRAGAVALAERIRVNVERLAFQNGARKINVTISGGVAYHLVGETINALFSKADRKLYEAKKTGRNRICS